eukprot:scaffold346_cov116-Cylindrotheca_fusiformis.AAC.31
MSQLTLQRQRSRRKAAWVFMAVASGSYMLSGSPKSDDASLAPVQPELEELKKQLASMEARHETLEAATEGFRMKSKILQDMSDEEKNRYNSLLASKIEVEEKLLQEIEDIRETERSRCLGLEAELSTVNEKLTSLNQSLEEESSRSGHLELEKKALAALLEEKQIEYNNSVKGKSDAEEKLGIALAEIEVLKSDRLVIESSLKEARRQLEEELSRSQHLIGLEATNDGNFQERVDQLLTSIKEKDEELEMARNKHDDLLEQLQAANRRFTALQDDLSPTRRDTGIDDAPATRLDVAINDAPTTRRDDVDNYVPKSHQGGGSQKTEEGMHLKNGVFAMMGGKSFELIVTVAQASWEALLGGGNNHDDHNAKSNVASSTVLPPSDTLSYSKFHQYAVEFLDAAATAFHESNDENSSTWVRASSLFVKANCGLIVYLVELILALLCIDIAVSSIVNWWSETQAGQHTARKVSSYDHSKPNQYVPTECIGDESTTASLPTHATVTQPVTLYSARYQCATVEQSMFAFRCLSGVVPRNISGVRASSGLSNSVAQLANLLQTQTDRPPAGTGATETTTQKLKNKLAFRISDKYRKLPPPSKHLDCERYDVLRCLASNGHPPNEKFIEEIENLRTSDENVPPIPPETLQSSQTTKYEEVLNFIFKQDKLRAVPLVVSLREDLLQVLRIMQRSHPDYTILKDFEEHLKQRLSLWFSPTSLDMRRITYESSTPYTIELLAKKEAVHPVQSLEELRNRLGPGRRVFEENEPSTATFYSISNSQPGLAGLQLGEYLLKSAIASLQLEIPSVKAFATLSPMPGFKDWLDATINYKKNDCGSNRSTFHDETFISREDIHQLKEEGVRLEDIDRVLEFFSSSLMTTHNSETPTLTEEMLVIKRFLMKLACRYLLLAKHRRRPFCGVSRFHVGNGAQVYRVNFGADMSPKGIQQSYSMMVNYKYDMDRITENQDRFKADYFIPASAEVLRMIGEESEKIQ